MPHPLEDKGTIHLNRHSYIEIKRVNKKGGCILHPPLKLLLYLMSTEQLPIFELMPKAE
jgi:hypothetical protein